MTFQKTAYAIDGALLTSALVRRAHYASTGGNQGVVQPGDLKVTQLDVPGVGVQIAPGVGLVLNDYQTKPNETYTVSNPGVHVVPSGQMPAANPAAKSWIVAVVIGDPEFSQSGHPWMLPSDPPAGTETTFEYVRVTLIEVPAGSTDVPGAFPALPLARIDIPAMTTTITNAMITDLTRLAQVRSSMQMFQSPMGVFSGANERYMVNSGVGAGWGEDRYLPQVRVPTWARRAIIVTNVDGIGLIDSTVNVTGAVRNGLGSKLSNYTSFDMDQGTGAIRFGLTMSGEYDVSDVAGTTQSIRLIAFQNLPASAPTARRAKLMNGSNIVHDVRFFEE